MIKLLTKKFQLNQSDISESLKFAQTANDMESQSSKDFGRADIIRDNNDQTADIAQGKMAEICFKKFLKENFDLDIKLDFNHYPGQQEIDFGNDLEEVYSGEDLKICTYRVDVKSTKMYSKWLLVEGHKFWSSAYCSVKIDLPNDYERHPFSAKSPIEAEIAGFAYHSDFIDPLTKKPWVGYSKNDCLLNPDDIDFGVPPQPVDIKQLSRNLKIRKLGNSRLKSNKNYALPIKFLRKEPNEWEKLVHFIKSCLIDKTNQIMLNQKANKKNPVYKDVAEAWGDDSV